MSNTTEQGIVEGNKHYLVKEDNGQKTVHMDGVFQPGDSALCGQDLIGDGMLGWGEATLTDKKVNCHSCIRLIEYCKTVNKSELQHQ